VEIHRIPSSLIGGRAILSLVEEKVKFRSPMRECAQGWVGRLADRA